MRKDKPISRRQFLVLGCGAVCTAVLAASCQQQEQQGGTTTQRTRCPRGLVNDPYPGRCRLYRDSTGNRICDLSELT